MQLESHLERVRVSLADVAGAANVDMLAPDDLPKLEVSEAAGTHCVGRQIRISPRIDLDGKYLGADRVGPERQPLALGAGARVERLVSVGRVHGCSSASSQFRDPREPAARSVPPSGTVPKRRAIPDLGRAETD